MTTIDLAFASAASATGHSKLDPCSRGIEPVCLPLVDAGNTRVVGGKACALGRMMRVGIAVPAGVVLTTRALDSYLSTIGAEQVSGFSIDGGLPAEVRAALVAHVGPLLQQGAVVVRSSAIGEDGASESFAGQLDSVLHVRDIVSLEDAVVRVWASLWSERVAFYRKARGLPVRGMGVVIQQQVDARMAGVLFTSTTSGEMLVEYGQGLADRLVAGEVDPARAAIDRRTSMVRMIAAPDGRALDDSVASQLRDVGLSLEGEFGGPQDVEWAVDKRGRLFVVQSRPITVAVAIPSTSTAGNGSARRIAWSNANVNENFPRPVSPLLYSIASAGYTHYFRNLAVACGVARDRIAAMEPAFRQIIGVHGARMYYNLTSIHSVLRLAPFGAAISRSFDTFVGADGTGVETRTPVHRGTLRQIAELPVIAIKSTRLLAGLERGVRQFEQIVDDFAARSDPARLDRMSLAALGDLLAEFIDIRCHKWLGASAADGAAMITYGALERLLRGAGLGESAHTSLLTAIPNVVSGEPVLRLWDLAQLVRRDPALADLFSNDAAAVPLAIRTEERFADFRAAFDRYVDEWGFRCSEELMLTSPSFQEDPKPLIDLLRAYLHADSTSPREALRAQAAAREAETRRIAASLSPVRAATLEILLPRVHASIRYRERARLKQALLYSRCRRIALAMGSELVRRELIVDRDEVFFLTWQELVALATGGAMLPESTTATVDARKREHARLSGVVPPDAFTLAEGEFFGAAAIERQASATSESTSDILIGASACAGRVTGRATVLESVTQSDRLAPGDVLVTKQTDPGWGPAFFLISGLVIERGGMLSHGAIIAREFGVPCVVGVKDAMRRIPLGATITVDGDKGTVHVIA